MSTPSVNIRHFDTFSQITDAVVGATAVVDVMTGPCRIVGITVYNATASATAGFLKFWDNTNPTVGTTAPDYCFYIPINFVDSISLPTDGMNFVNGCSYAFIKNVGVADGPGTSGTNPSLVTVKVGLTALEGLN